jgi:glycine oxidase
VVIATGWAAPALAEPLGLAPGLVRPIKGHILRLVGEGTDQLERVTRAPGVYLVPRPDGLVVGATMQPDRADVTIEPEVVEALHQAAAAVFPALAGAKVAEARAGVRGASPDGLPLVGAAGAPGVHLALAPRRNGWLLAPLVARSVAASLLGEDDPAGGAFRPDRF